MRTLLFRQSLKWLASVLAVWSGYSWARRTLSKPSEPLILSFHSVGTHGALNNLSIDPCLFDQLMSVAARLFQLTSLQRALDKSDRAGHSRQPSQLAITFDDGYKDNLTNALPIIQRLAGSATVFVSPALLDERRPPWSYALNFLIASAPLSGLEEVAARSGFISEVELGDRNAIYLALDRRLRGLELMNQRAFLLSLAEQLGQRDFESWLASQVLTYEDLAVLVEAGWEIGSHAMTHTRLSNLSPEAIREELRLSREILRGRLGVDCQCLAYPFGSIEDVPTEATEMAAEVGYRWSVSLCSGGSRPHSRMWLPRRLIGAEDITNPFGRFSRAMATCALEGTLDFLRVRRPRRSN